MKRIKASTLQESIIAMTIILICLSVGLMVFVNIMHSDRATDRLKANILKKEILTNTKAERSFIEDEIQRDEFVVRKNIYDFESNKDLGIIEIAVLKNEKELTTIKETFIRNERYE